MVNLSVIIPVVQVEMAVRLIRQMESNTFLPTKIILIDNSLGGFIPESSIPINRIRPSSPPLGVNKSWNMGVALAKKADFVSIFNDDIIINPFLFERIMNTMKSCDKCAVACPETVSVPQIVKVARRNGEAEGMQTFEGWAFTIRGSVLEGIPPIPEELVVFCGDDWYWYWTVKRMGMSWLKLKYCYIYHYVGSSVGRVGYKQWLKADREAFNRITTELEKDGN